MTRSKNILTNIPAHISGVGTITDHQKMVEESEARYMAIRTYAPRVHSTCSAGGLIDYFVTHANEHHILEDVTVIEDTVVTPHSPVAATIREDIYQTRTLQHVVAPKWPQCDPVHERASWEKSTTCPQG